MIQSQYSAGDRFVPAGDNEASPSVVVACTISSRAEQNTYRQASQSGNACDWLPHHSLESAIAFADNAQIERQSERTIEMEVQRHLIESLGLIGRTPGSELRIDDKQRNAIEARAEEIAKEYKAENFGPASQKAWGEYLRWMESSVLPQLAAGVDAKPIEGENVSRDKEGRTVPFKVDRKTGHVDLHIDGDKPPDLQSAQRLDQIYSWMKHDLHKDLDQLFPAPRPVEPEGSTWFGPNSQRIAAQVGLAIGERVVPGFSRVVISALGLDKDPPPFWNDGTRP